MSNIHMYKYTITKAHCTVSCLGSCTRAESSWSISKNCVIAVNKTAMRGFTQSAWLSVSCNIKATLDKKWCSCDLGKNNAKKEKHLTTLETKEELFTLQQFLLINQHNTGKILLFFLLYKKIIIVLLSNHLVWILYLYSVQSCVNGVNIQ